MRLILTTAENLSKSPRTEVCRAKVTRSLTGHSQDSLEPLKGSVCCGHSLHFKWKFRVQNAQGLPSGMVSVVAIWGQDRIPDRPSVHRD